MLVKIISIMLENTYTADDLVERLGLMRTYYGKKIYADNSAVTVDDVLATECDQHTLKVLKTWETSFAKNNIQPVVVYEALDAVQEEFGGIPTVTLYTPVHFPPEHIERFGKWFRANVQPNILMSVHVDPRATGGCNVVWNGTHYDYSLRYYMHKHRADIVNLFNTQTHA
jgi:F0F1-type ATP synthase delta subunit